MHANLPCELDVRAVLVAGVGFFLDSYDIFAINLISTLLGLVFWGGEDSKDRGHMPDSINQALKASTSAGIIVGMVLFGWLAEYVFSQAALPPLGPVLLRRSLMTDTIVLTVHWAVEKCTVLNLP